VGAADEGVAAPEDNCEVETRYRLAAEQGDAKAQFNLGVMHVKGEGMSQDYVRGHMWIDLASANASPKDAAHFRNSRDKIAAKMTPAQISEAQALASKFHAANFKDCD